MRITKDMVGKLIRGKTWEKGVSSVKVLCVGNRYLFVEDKDEFRSEYAINIDNNWELVEEQKLPSEIIGFSPGIILHNNFSNVWEKMNGIVKFLDEQAKKGVFK